MMVTEHEDGSAAHRPEEAVATLATRVIEQRHRLGEQGLPGLCHASSGLVDIVVLAILATLRHAAFGTSPDEKDSATALTSVAGEASSRKVAM